MTYPVTPDNVFSVPVSDPLAGLTRPTGNPDSVKQAADAYAAAANELERVSNDMTGAVGTVVGGAWIGNASASCGDAVGRVAEKYKNAATYASEGAGALQACENQWRAALQQYDQARSWANEAVADERAYLQRAEQDAAERAATGDEGGAVAIRRIAATYQHPLRMQSSRAAAAAIGDFNQATQQACGKLDATAHDLAAAGALTSPTQAEGAVQGLSIAGGHMLSRGEFVPRMLAETEKQYALSRGMAETTAQGKVWERRAKTFQRAGLAFAFVTAGVGQWMKDARLHPNMETDEQVARAVTQAGAVGAGGALVGMGASWATAAAIGATVGSAVPGLGTAVGFLVGAAVGIGAGILLDNNTDSLVDGIGNMAEGAGEAIGSAWDTVTFWD